jgi:hypothetical protein
MFRRRLVNNPLLLGLIVGLVFGSVNLVFTWLYPLDDDGPAALLRFYGPMFFVWALASFRAARRSGRLLSGVTTGMFVAFATFCVFDVLVLLRVNLFLNDLTGRAHWQNMVMRFRRSGFDSLRVFVNLEYIKGAPLKIGVASVIGMVMGAIGGSLGRLRHERTIATAEHRLAADGGWCDPEPPRLKPRVRRQDSRDTLHA